MGGDYCLPGGNGRLVHALAENVSIIFEKTMFAIRYGRDCVKVTTGEQLFEGDMALCTVLSRSFEEWFYQPVDEHLDRNGLLDKASKLKQEVFSRLEAQIHIVITRIFQLGGSEFPYHKPVEGSISYLLEPRGVELKQLATT
ncbi:hypothetical protein MTR67_043864 [Solanum verrucosum]|uniref:Uncharacterized protein n=1 Tax=Solanum verrucosum TaxID=315347 RepID=A0AAF0ZVI8_SOLVR|nr:hypothetical protein MTR67_043864 [Solanum verrucosum]